MQHTIDTRLEVSWCAELSDGTRVFDKKTDENDISEWLKLLKHIKDTPGLKVKRLHIFSMANKISDTTFHGMITPPDAGGYFFINQLTVSMFGSYRKDSVGFGHLIDPETIDVRWYTLRPDKQLDLEKREQRKAEIGKETLGLIRNE